MYQNDSALDSACAGGLADQLTGEAIGPPAHARRLVANTDRTTLSHTEVIRALVDLTCF
jgi:hypothetical protein